MTQPGVFRAFALAVAASAAVVPPGLAQEPPTFPTRSEIVVLDLVARDKGGRPVEDLQLDDVRVFEDGLPCLVRSVRLVRADADAPSGSVVAAPASTAKAPAAPVVVPAVVPPRGNVVLLVFDRISPPNAAATSTAATALVSRPFPAGTWIGVVALREDARLVQSITDDMSRLPGAVSLAVARSGAGAEPPRNPDRPNATVEAMTAAVAASGSATGLAGIDPTATLALRGTPGPSGPAQTGAQAEAKQRETEARVLGAIDALNRERLGRSALSALLHLSRALGAIDGRKTLVLFSEGLSVPDVVADALATVVSEANRASVAVYAFDARGLSAEDSSAAVRAALLSASHNTERAMRSRGDEEESTRGVSPQEVKAQDVALDALRLDTQRNLRELAEATGGFLVANSNDLSTAVERVGADLRRYYEVAYAPPNPIADGQFRRIEVRLARRGVTVRTRRGYFALPSGETSTLPYEAALAEALAQAPLPRDVTFAVTATPTAPAGGTPTVDVRVEVPLRDLQIDRTPDGYRGQFSVLLLVRDASGRVAAKLSHDWPVSAAPGGIAETQARSATVRRALELAPGTYTIETVVRDRRSGRVGASRTPLVVGR